ncbi:N-acetyltransferase [Labrys miyagiensis]|uniref:N-acetyltransferase n=1 Tax=Labrys miyagiensis TaxID=346912 RepID=A0ABQ6CSW6_9HYPH|nr:GNAT family N-acetyltransferase [Labrys miyagiensis]GLS23471.1 N-acetyltransferase [Labrys miyagiensis]
MAADVEIHALTSERWPDLETLFGPEKGANSGCWCMWLRVNGPLFRDMERAGRKAAFQALVAQETVPGLLAYSGGEAVGWCAVGPRENSTRFHASKAARLTVDFPPGSIFALTCFFIRSDWRRKGLTRLLTLAARDFAVQAGATALDVCPIASDKPLIWGEGFVGIESVFRDLGFEEIARRSERRPLMRLALNPP